MSGNKDIKKHFDDLITNKCKNNQTSEVTKVIKFLVDADLDPTYQEGLICGALKRKREDALQYALRKQQYRLFLALFAKVNQWAYVNRHNLLRQAIEAQKDKDRHLAAILLAYNQYKLPIDINTLPEPTKQKLYDGSWSLEIIKGLYNQTNSFFIPRGQGKAKMQALIYYNTFTASGSTLPRRYDAEDEAENIDEGLREGGFTVRPILVDWAREEYLVHLQNNLKAIKTECSVLVMCIMSHGGNAFVYDKNGVVVEINEIMNIIDSELANLIPVVSCQIFMLIQECLNILLHLHECYNVYSLLCVI